MREIKFRAWDKIKRIMCSIREFDPCIVVQDGCFEIYQGEDCYFEFMQYTGLKDKNGKEIYEGDILKSGDEIIIVKWISQNNGFDITGFEAGFSPNSDEVVGNIHENPELLK